MSAAKRLKVCPEGHKFYKSSDCPNCPICEELKKPGSGFLSQLSAPARRALENEGIHTLKQLSGYSEKAIRALHGMGPATIPILIQALKAKGLSFKTQSKSMSGVGSIDEYIKGFEPGIQKKLQQLRKTIQKAALTLNITQGKIVI